MLSHTRTIWIVSHQNQLMPLLNLFETRGFKVKYHNSLDALGNFGASPDLIISDISKNENDIFLKLSHLNFPFLIISECHNLEILQSAFSYGALDFIVHPGNTSEIIAKVEFALKKIDLKNSVLVVPPKIENLTQKESLLFNLFFNNLNQELSREAIVAEIWGGLVIYRKSLDVHLHHLRKKLKSYKFVIHYGENNKWKMSKCLE